MNGHPLLQLAAVHGRDSRGPAGRAVGALRGVSVTLEHGIHAFVGRPADGTLALIELVAGRRRPSVGVVTVRGREPGSHAGTRRKVGALLDTAELLPARTVAELVAQIGALHGADLSGCLEAFGASALAARAPASLDRDEARSVELAVALSLQELLVLALYEPFTRTRLDADAVCGGVVAAAERGGCVVVATSTPADLRALGGVPGSVHLLERGRLWGRDGAIGWPPRPGRALRIWLEPEHVRALGAALSGRSELAAVSWEAAADRPLASILVSGGDADEVALAVAETVSGLGTPVHALESEAPSLELLLDAARREREAIEARSPYSPTPRNPGGGAP
jgi:ABC-2 type transport system ATP-binding protein